MAKIGKKTHRTSLRKKHKIEKKVREHHRKMRKEARNNPLNRQKIKKDPGIPNMYPYKEQMLAKMSRQQERLEEDKRKRNKELARRRGMITSTTEAASTEGNSFNPTTIAELARSANQRAIEFEEKQLQKRVEFQALTDNSKKAYFREFKKVVEGSDVIFEVLDARDPLGCRCTQIESMILARYPNKRIVLILNKVDLVPKEVALEWLKHLRNSFPTFLFKATTSGHKKFNRTSHSVSVTNATDGHLRSAECLGADTIIQLLKNYSRKSGLKTAITAGVIGYPNVGKSSLINSLKRSKAVGVGATPGFTKKMQEIQLDKKVKLLDCPGIVFDAASNDVDITLRNCTKIEKIDAPEVVVEALLRRCQKKDMMMLYEIPGYTSHMEFLALVARKRGRLNKGGVPDYIAAARSILQDWNEGKIKFFTHPPKDANRGVHVDAQVVDSWADEFDVRSVMLAEAEVLDSLKDMDSCDNYMEIAATEDTAMDEFIQGLERLTIEEEQATTATSTAQDLYTEEDQYNPQVNQERKRQLKKKKKDARRGRFVEDDDDSFPSNDFDFTTDFVADNDDESEEGESEEDESDDENDDDLMLDDEDF